jgi:NAD(P)-dependent dehydrogenase (short-subunit alcohol dehydrogenase family)
MTLLLNRNPAIRDNRAIRDIQESFESLKRNSEQWLGGQPEPEAARRQIEVGIPFGQRMTTTEEVANMVTFFLSPQSSHTTGQLIYVDGGYRSFLII